MMNRYASKKGARPYVAKKLVPANVTQMTRGKNPKGKFDKISDKV